MSSIILKSIETNKIYIYSKGADISIIPKLTNQNDESIHFVNEFAREGLRTLLFAYRELDESELVNLGTPELLEKNLELLAITGVEDLLQDEVAPCITDFREAGIKVWMLTGDKGETAEQIGYSCAMFEKDKPGFCIKHFEAEGETKAEDPIMRIHELTSQIGTSEKDQVYSLMVSGDSLHAIMNNPDIERELF